MFKIVTHFLGEVYSLTFSLTDRSKTNQNEQQHSVYSIHGCDSAIEKMTEICMRSNKEVQGYPLINLIFDLIQNDDYTVKKSLIICFTSSVCMLNMLKGLLQNTFHLFMERDWL